MDNAGNNDTLMETLSEELSRRRIRFDRYAQHIR